MRSRSSPWWGPRSRPRGRWERSLAELLVTHREEPITPLRSYEPFKEGEAGNWIWQSTIYLSNLRKRPLLEVLAALGDRESYGRDRHCPPGKKE